MCTIPTYLLKREALLTLLLAASVLALAGALTAQYGFGLQPCVLCLYQRVPYAVILMLVVTTHLWRNFPLRYFLLLATLTFLSGTALAAYHAGIEWHWWRGSEGCSGGATVPGSIEELRARLVAAPAVRCDEPALVILGLSMAGWNAIYSLALAAFSFCAWRSVGKK